jgi:hypothetical protein
MDRVRTGKCYCDIPREVLGYLAREHFVNDVPTQELMTQVQGDEWREWVAIVALLDVPQAELLPMLELENPLKLPHWLGCHQTIRQTLADEGVVLRH